MNLHERLYMTQDLPHGKLIPMDLFDELMDALDNVHGGYTLRSEVYYITNGTRICGGQICEINHKQPFDSGNVSTNYKLDTAPQFTFTAKEIFATKEAAKQHIIKQISEQ